MVKDSFGRDWSLENMKDCVDRGWHPLIENLYELCDKNSIDVFQVKEKYGGLRFYTGAASEEIEDAISLAEKKSFELCEVCGDKGECRKENDWWRTRCEKHI